MAAVVNNNFQAYSRAVTHLDTKCAVLARLVDLLDAGAPVARDANAGIAWDVYYKECAQSMQVAKVQPAEMVTPPADDSYITTEFGG